MRTDPNQANDIANYRALVLYDFDAMTRMDWETERRRLADLHARMEEAELEELAAHGETLRRGAAVGDIRRGLDFFESFRLACPKDCGHF